MNDTGEVPMKSNAEGVAERFALTGPEDAE